MPWMQIKNLIQISVFHSGRYGMKKSNMHLSIIEDRFFTETLYQGPYLDLSDGMVNEGGTPV
jgi:hypothetical protein